MLYMMIKDHRWGGHSQNVGSDLSHSRPLTLKHLDIVGDFTRHHKKTFGCTVASSSNMTFALWGQNFA